MGRLSGKVAIITGAGQGIGRSTALAFAKEGAEVIATDVDITKLEDLKAIPGIKGVHCIDVTKKDSITAFARQIKRVNVIFNCAGVVPGGNILGTTDEVWEKTMNLNLRGAFWVTQALLPIALENKETCSIINMSSVASSIKGVVDRFAYSVSKGGLIALTKSIAADFIGDGIRANNICPGTVDTPSFRERVNQSPDPKLAMEKFLERQKMGRLGTAEEIAALVIYLASDEAAYVTGQEFIIDGGWCL